MPILQFEEGDLVFTQIGPPDNAISTVTEGWRGARVNHVGIVMKNGHGVFVLEAFPPEVRLTNIEVHLRRSRYEDGEPRAMVGRLRPEHRAIIPAALTYGIEQRDIPYDRLYLTDEAALYCSELVVDMFKHASGGVEFFLEEPMRFHDAATGGVLPAWQAYYDYFGVPVPVGEPGSNPGGLSRDPKLEITAVHGPISGYQP